MKIYFIIILVLLLIEEGNSVRLAFENKDRLNIFGSLFYSINIIILIILQIFFT